MQELIERLEKATGPGADLDIEIYKIAEGHKAAEGSIIEYMSDPHGTSFWRCRHPPQEFGSWWVIAPYTESIDVALTLIPPWSWRVGNFPSGRGFADLGTQTSMQCIEGATPAIALCIAALKARASLASHKSEN